MTPASEAEATALILDALNARKTLRLEGGGTRAGLGAPVEADRVLSTRAMQGIVFHEPAEMVIRARAGTPLAEVEAALAEKGQMLPFEPMDHRRLYATQGAPTIGAVAACNISGPRRIAAGAARDSLIGLRFINGRGEIIRAGGRVMKNVTGLDMVKLQSGAAGAFGLITEVTFKVLPRPPARATLRLPDLDARQAIAAMSAVLASPFEIGGAAFVPEQGVFLRLEHFEESIAYRTGALRERLRAFGEAETIDGVQADVLWRDMGDAAGLAQGTRDVWRIALAPSRAPALLAAATAELADCTCTLDWGGGLILLATGSQAHEAAAILRAAVAGQGSVRMLRGSEYDRARFAGDDLSPAVAALAARVKASIDPAGLFNMPKAPV